MDSNMEVSCPLATKDRQDLIDCLKELSLIPCPHDQERQKELAIEFIQVVDILGLDLSDPVKAFPSGRFNPLFSACQSGNLAIVKAIVERGASLDIDDGCGNSPLYYAVTSQFNSHTVVASLIQLGARVDVSSNRNCPLGAAFYLGKQDTVSVLLNHGADVNNLTLPAGCFVDSVLALHTNMVIMAAGHQLQPPSVLKLVGFCTEIVLAGLHQRYFYLSAKRVLNTRFSHEELLALWKFQYLCMTLNFKVCSRSLDQAIQETKCLIQNDERLIKAKWMSKRLDKLLWMQTYQSSPLPLTFLTRIAIRSHLSTMNVGGVAHVNTKIDRLQIPEKCLNFLKMKDLEMSDVRKYMTL